MDAVVEPGDRLRLPDGRVLGFAEVGDPFGLPVFYFHGVPGVRVGLVGRPADYVAAGIRLITVDRPGCGVSTRNPAGSLLDWPADIEELAMVMGFDRYAIVAESGGGPFALACAYAHPERLTAVVVSSGAGPMDQPWSRDGIKPLNRAVMELLPKKRLAALILQTLGSLYLRWPDFVVDSLLCHDSPIADLELLGLSEMRASTRRMLTYATANGVGGLVDELALLVEPWPFDPHDIRMGVNFWHGDADNTVPVSHARYLAQAIGGSSLVVCPGEGHLVLERHLPEVLDVVRRSYAAAALPAGYRSSAWATSSR